MSRNAKTTWFRSGISLPETMNSIAILSIALIGISGYRYCSTLDARKADAYMASARIGQLLCESWRGLHGSETYDPVTHLESGIIITPGDGPAAPGGYNALGSYQVVMNDITFYATLSWKDLDINLRALNIVLIWAQRIHEQKEIDDADKSFKLTTYVQI